MLITTVWRAATFFAQAFDREKPVVSPSVPDLATVSEQDNGVHERVHGQGLVETTGTDNRSD